MKNLFCLLLMINACLCAASQRITGQQVIAIYQLDDEEGAAFEFFTREKIHKCNKEVSGRFRSYSNNATVAERNFQLTLKAFENKGKLSFRSVSCEGKAMLVDQIGIQR